MLKLFDCDKVIGDVTVNKGCLLANEFIIVVENQRRCLELRRALLMR